MAFSDKKQNIGTQHARTNTTHAHKYNTRTRTQKKLTSTTHAHEYNTRSRNTTHAHEIQKKHTNTTEAHDSEQKLLIRNIATLRKPCRLTSNLSCALGIQEGSASAAPRKGAERVLHAEQRGLRWTKTLKNGPPSKILSKKQGGGDNRPENESDRVTLADTTWDQSRSRLLS